MQPGPSRNTGHARYKKRQPAAARGVELKSSAVSIALSPLALFLEAANLAGLGSMRPAGRQDSEAFGRFRECSGGVGSGDASAPRALLYDSSTRRPLARLRCGGNWQRDGLPARSYSKTRSL